MISFSLINFDLFALGYASQWSHRPLHWCSPFMTSHWAQERLSLPWATESRVFRPVQSCILNLISLSASYRLEWCQHNICLMLISTKGFELFMNCRTTFAPLMCTCELPTHTLHTTPLSQVITSYAKNNTPIKCHCVLSTRSTLKMVCHFRTGCFLKSLNLSWNLYSCVGNCQWSLNKQKNFLKNIT